jgi:hypothetical protein
MRVASFIPALALLICALPSSAQTPPPATDFEWELQVPNRVLFRDRVPVGRIPLTVESKSGFFGSRKSRKNSGEALALWVEAAFVPGDTARFLALTLELNAGELTRASAVLDAAEFPSLCKSVEYVLSTARNIAGTERSDTRVVYRSLGGLELVFTQRMKVQRVELRFPARNGEQADVRPLSREQLSLLKDLLDLALFELKRQGASLPAEEAK